MTGSAWKELRAAQHDCTQRDSWPRRARFSEKCVKVITTEAGFIPNFNEICHLAARLAPTTSLLVVLACQRFWATTWPTRDHRWRSEVRQARPLVRWPASPSFAGCVHSIHWMRSQHSLGCFPRVLAFVLANYATM